MQDQLLQHLLHHGSFRRLQGVWLRERAGKDIQQLNIPVYLNFVDFLALFIQGSYALDSYTEVKNICQYIGKKNS